MFARGLYIVGLAAADVECFKALTSAPFVTATAPSHAPLKPWSRETFAAAMVPTTASPRGYFSSGWEVEHHNADLEVSMLDPNSLLNSSRSWPVRFEYFGPEVSSAAVVKSIVIPTMVGNASYYHPRQQQASRRVQQQGSAEPPSGLRDRELNAVFLDLLTTAREHLMKPAAAPEPTARSDAPAPSRSLPVFGHRQLRPVDIVFRKDLGGRKLEASPQEPALQRGLPTELVTSLKEFLG